MKKSKLETPTVYKVLITIVLLLTLGAMFLDVFRCDYSSTPAFDYYGTSSYGNGGLSFFGIFDFSLWRGAESLIMVITIVAVFASIGAIWINKSKVSLIALGVITLFVLLSLFRFYNVDGSCWYSPISEDYCRASASSPYYIVLGGTALAILFGVVGHLNTKEPIEKAPNITVAQQSNADELEKYNELLSKGVITQEEFDAKKKQLLGL